MAVNTKFLPQLLVYEDEEAKKIVSNLKKIEIKNEYKIVDLGIKEYVSMPKLDQKAFRYVVKNGQMYLRESVYSVGGLVADTVMIHLGEFIEGDDELGLDLSYIAKIKDAKTKQRQRQLKENERIALWALGQVNRLVKNAELINKWQQDLEEAKRFVRLGKEDYNQSKIDILAKYAKEDENLAKIVVEYNTRINSKNEKWLSEKLKLSKKSLGEERIGTNAREGIGEITPKRREDFEKFYEKRSLQIQDYLVAEEEITADLPIVPEIIYEAPQREMEEVEKAPTKIKEEFAKVGLEKMKRTFVQTKDEIEISR